MTKTKTPAPRRAGTAKRAEKLARWITRELGGNPAALYVAQQMIGLLATQARRDLPRSD